MNGIHVFLAAIRLRAVRRFSVLVARSLVLLALAAAAAYSQQQFIQTVTAQNKNCNTTCSVIDVPELNGNPVAVIFITPIVNNGFNINPHPIGAYYMYLKKWSVFNLDGVTIPDGAKFKIEYYTHPDANAFVYTVPRQVHLSDIPYIDREGLNDNPNATVRLFPTSSPSHGALYNKDDVKALYDETARKWYVVNLNNKPVPWESVYNVEITIGGVANVAPQSPVKTVNDKNIFVPPRVPPPILTTTEPNVAAPVQSTAPKAGTPLQSTKVPIKAPLNRPNTERWILRADEQPAIPPNSDILLFIHGMDSRAEEADDITNALFALKANPSAAAAPTPSNAQMVADLNRILHKYEGCILEKYETQQDMADRGLGATLSGLANTNGLQNRDSIACVAGNICSRTSRQASFNALQTQANNGNATNFETNIKRSIPADCFQCTKHSEWHTKHVHCTMDAGGNYGFPAGVAFESCKAGVDIAKLVTDLINDIHAGLTGAGGGSQGGGSTIATNYSTVHFDTCAIPSEGCPETCDHPDSFTGGARTAVMPFETINGQQIPLYLEPMVPLSLLDTPPPNLQINVPPGHNIGKNEGRLRPDLRGTAVAGDPLLSLRLATYKYAGGDNITGQAFADLSVTGRRAFAAFRIALPNEPFCQSLIADRPALITETAVLDGCRTALDRAYRVANFLRTGQRGDTTALKEKKTAERTALGWIAVSGEDDQPHRPVNVPSSDYPQYDVDIVVHAPRSILAGGNVTVRTRYVIAQSQTANPGGRNLVVISLDLPTSGYSENLNYEVVSPLSDIGTPKWTFLPVPLPIPPEVFPLIATGFVAAGQPPPATVISLGTTFPDFQATGKTPLLDFIEDFIVRFAETLHEKNYVDKYRFKAVMGGSLGGNMTFRLGRRPNADWLPKFIVWSPASIWTSLGSGADILKHIGPRTAWDSANRASNSPTAGDRAEFFGGWDKPILPLIIPMAQSDTWTSDYYPCKKSSVAGARLDRQETYDAHFLAWHWRLGGEQLLFSHQNIDTATQRPLFLRNQKPMLLGCGLEDRVPFNDICPATQSTAKMMTTTPGKAIFLDHTGHSVDNERRRYFAREIIQFLGL